MVWTGGSQGTLAPALVALFEQADALWPDRSTASDGSLGDTDHASRTSDHNPKVPNPPGWVDAADLTYDPAHGVDHFVLAEQIRLRRDPRVKYVIFFGQVFKSYVDSAGRPAWEWQPYTGVNAHKQHMHISVTPEGRGDTSSWFQSGAPVEEDFLSYLTYDEQRRLLKGVDDLSHLLPFVKEQTDRLPHIHAASDALVWGVLDPGQGLRAMVAGIAGVDPDDVDEAALAAALAPLIPSALPNLSDEDVERIAKASADEQARRLGG